MKDNILDTPVSNIMTEDVFIIGAGDRIQDVSILFANHGIRHAPVSAQGRLTGMISLVDLKKVPERDLLTAVKSEAPESNRGSHAIVADLMTHDPVSIQAGDTVGELAQIFAENEFHAVPVLEGNRIVGIVSTTDLIRFFLESLS